MIADELTVPSTTVPAAVIVAEPIVIGVAQVELVPHSYIVTVGLPVQLNELADPSMLSTVDALENLWNAPLPLVTAVINPGWKLT